MSELDQYHCFWVEPVGVLSKYEATQDFERVQYLVSENAKSLAGEYSNVRSLRVVYGELLEFEPVEVVTKWKIKGE